jgi:asparagine synthase (glutamine-hydrolysing)
MCGFTGFYRPENEGREASLESLRDMNEALKHRGPDDEGLHLDGEVGLAHRRLSILDLSVRARQPMADSEKRFWIAYNGEIYNYMEIRKDLHEYEFTTTSDTEVIIAAFRKWGIDCLGRFIGMFAFALYDSLTKRLVLVRDRLGVKPLYYYHHRGHLVFASELKALIRYPSFEKALDFQSLFEYLVFQYVPEPRTIYEHTFKLPPGTYLVAEKGAVEVKTYWDIPLEGNHGPSVMSENDYGARFEELLSDSVRLRQISDVPLGAFLSGGIDSSTIVAFMAAQHGAGVKTFSIGFQEQFYDEAPYARKVADYLGTEHHELYVTPKEACDVIPLLPQLYDEPFSDSSAIPTYLVSKEARRHVTVCLSGDGGDELFFGYNRYAMMKKMSMGAGIPLRKEFMSGLSRLPDSIHALMGSMARALFFRSMKTQRITPARVREALSSMGKDPIEVYLGLVKIWGREEAGRLLGGGAYSLDAAPFFTLHEAFRHVKEPERFSFIDIKTYLPGDILTKVDRASMAVGLEARVPLLDHRIVEFACALPFVYKYRNRESKYLLKKLLYTRIPAEFFRRPKQGFGIPISQWLSHDLRHLVDEYLDAARIRREGILDPRLVETMVRRHLKGQEDHGYRLYNLLMFQMWKERWM